MPSVIRRFSCLCIQSTRYAGPVFGLGSVNSNILQAIIFQFGRITEWAKGRVTTINDHSQYISLITDMNTDKYKKGCNCLNNA